MAPAQYFEPSFDTIAKPRDASAKVSEDVVEAENEIITADCIGR